MNLKMKAILIIADGMADRPIKELNWKTPLEIANKPSLNMIAKTGVCGIMDLISPGIPPGSDAATLALLGYDALKVYSGRGALEAIGSGLEVFAGDVAFRCNFATVNEKRIVLDRRAGRISNEDAAQLTRSLEKVKLKQSHVKFTFKNTIQHRAVLVLHGSKLSTAVSDSDPGKTGVKVSEIKPLDKSPEAKQTANIVNELMNKFRKVLEAHPINKKRIESKMPTANFILCRGAGKVPNIKPLPQVYGVKGTCIGAAALVKGVCKVAGLDLTCVKGATGTPQTDFMAKAKATVQALEANDFVILHVKAMDVVSHDGDYKQKIELIEKFDKMISHILDDVDLDVTYIAVTADHTTSCITRDHEGDPVPVAITGPQVRRDDVMKFDERACSKGGLNRIRGMDIMPILMNFIGKSKKFGA